MKKFYIFLNLTFVMAIANAQPVLESADLQTGLNFNLYSLSAVDVEDLMASGENAIWDINTAVATLAGTAEFLDMSATPFENEYPTANFAMKFTISGEDQNYSLFYHSAVVLEEVATNVGTMDAVSFTNYRTTLVFPFSYNQENNDTYQKSGQAEKTISNTYDAYGSLLVDSETYTNTVRSYMLDDENTKVIWWKSSPLVPVLQGSEEGFILWELTTNVGLSENSSNDFFDLYPNPATDYIKIMNKVQLTGIEIYDSTGKLYIKSSLSVIDISGLTSGLYLIKALKGNESRTLKFIRK